MMSGSPLACLPNCMLYELDGRPTLFAGLHLFSRQLPRANLRLERRW